MKLLSLGVSVFKVLLYLTLRKETTMGWLRARFGEGNTLAGLAMLYMVARPLVPPQYQLLVDGVAAAVGVGGVAVPGNSTPKP